MAGFQVVTIPSDARGNCDLDALRAAVGPDTAGLMITNPNTLGLWDEHIEEIVAAVHEAGGLVYNDGANFNAILGIARPGDLGIDIMHFNLHKTFSTPHGGGGPGSGPVGVRQDLAKFLPGPRAASTRKMRSGTSSSSRMRASAACTPSTATSACSYAPTPTSACTARRGCAR